MKKWMLVVLVLAGSVSWGQAQIKIGNRTIYTKKVLNAASEVASAITLSDEDVAALCRESVKWMMSKIRFQTPDRLILNVWIR